MDQTNNDLTRNLSAAGSQSRAAAELLPLVYEELRRLAAARVLGCEGGGGRAAAGMARGAPGHTLQATALVHEAWVRLTGGAEKRWENRAHFFAAAAEAMRRILIENARRKARLKHGGHLKRMDMADLDLAETST